jgi:hypothetical protein
MPARSSFAEATGTSEIGTDDRAQPIGRVLRQVESEGSRVARRCRPRMMTSNNTMQTDKPFDVDGRGRHVHWFDGAKRPDMTTVEGGAQVDFDLARPVPSAD